MEILKKIKNIQSGADVKLVITFSVLLDVFNANVELDFYFYFYSTDLITDPSS